MFYTRAVLCRVCFLHDLPSDAFDWVALQPAERARTRFDAPAERTRRDGSERTHHVSRHLRVAWVLCEPDTTPQAFDAARTSRPCSSHCSTPSLQQSGIIRHAPNGRVSPSMDNRAMAELSAAGSQTLTQVWFLHRLSRASILRKLTPHGDQDSKTRCYKGAARRALSESGDVLSEDNCPWSSHGHITRSLEAIALQSAGGHR